jgi:hypothetical protein
MKKIILILAVAFFSSCERTLNINLNTGEQKLVLESRLDLDDYPYAVITRSVGFSNIFDISKAQFEKGARVSIKDLTSNDSIVLREYIFDTLVNNNPFQFIFHTIDITNPSHFAFVGKKDHTYEMQILNKGKLHTATTKIPQPHNIDSLWQELDLKKNGDSTYRIKCIWKDPDTIGNFFKIETQVLRKDKLQKLNEEWLTDFASVFDDAFTNGKRLPFEIELGFTKGVNFTDSASRNLFEKESRAYRGDTVIIRMSAIDYNVFQFWTTLEFSRNSTGNPFAAPTKVSSNISDAIGIFGGYGAAYDTLIIK